MPFFMNRRLGFPSGVAYSSVWLCQETGPIWMDDMDCDGDEDTLSDCSFPGWGIVDCVNDQDAGVKCGSCKYYRGMIPPFEMEQLSSF